MSNNVAIVTGAARSIGLATACQLSARGEGESWCLGSGRDCWWVGWCSSGVSTTFYPLRHRQSRRVCRPVCSRMGSTLKLETYHQPRRITRRTAIRSKWWLMRRTDVCPEVVRAFIFLSARPGQITAKIKSIAMHLI